MRGLKLDERELKESQTTRRLLVLQSLSRGVQADALANLLDKDPANFGKVFPARRLLKKGGSK